MSTLAVDVTGHQITAWMHDATGARDYRRRARLGALQDFYRATVWARFTFAGKQVPIAEACHWYTLAPASDKPLILNEITRAESITLTLEAPYDSLALEEAPA